MLEKLCECTQHRSSRSENKNPFEYENLYLCLYENPHEYENLYETVSISV